MRRSLGLYKNAHPLQRVTNFSDQFNIKYQKVLGKRHTIRHEPYHEIMKRMRELNLSSGFEDLKKVIFHLPKVEKEVEQTFVSDIKEKLTPEEQDELDAVYQHRRERIESSTYYTFLNPVKPEVTEEPLPRKRPDFEIKNLASPTEEEIGSYFPVSEETAKVLFKNGYFGTFLSDHVSLCNTYDIMMREETWRVVNVAKYAQGLSSSIPPDPLNLADLSGKEPLEQLEWVVSNHRTTYLRLHKTISNLVLDYVYATEDTKLFNIIRNSAELFNSTVAIILQELCKPQLFSHFSQNFEYSNCEEFLDRVSKSEDLKEIVKGVLSNYSSKINEKDALTVVHFEPFVKFISQEFRFDLCGKETVIKLHSYADPKVRFKVPKSLENEIDKTGSLSVGYVLSGHRGTGKSQILSGAAAWAHTEGNWVLIKVPRMTDYTKAASPYFWEPNGLYFHPEGGWDLLSEIYELNKEKLEKIPVDLSIYGKYSLSGVHPVYDKGYEPLINQHFYMREEQVWTDDWKKFYSVEILEDMFKGVRSYQMHPRKSRFEHETSFFTKEHIPKKFIDMDDDNVPNLLEEMKLEDVLGLKYSKRKQKKRMLPKSSSEDLKLRVKSRVIHPQDLAIDTDADMFPEEYTKKLAEVLPTPNNLKELVEFGLKSHMHSVSVLYELMEQLYRTDKANVMVLVDEYDACFRHTDYPSLKYMNFRHCRECIAPADISVCRLFMRFDGHMIRNGVKVVAVSEKDMNYHKRWWKGDPVTAGEQFCIDVGKLALDDLRKLANYLYFFDWTSNETTESDIASIYMMSQGNFSLALQNITMSTEVTY